jgi:hypothetical protein
MFWIGLGIFLLIMYLSGADMGGGADVVAPAIHEARAVVEHRISDEGRAAQAAKILDEMEAIAKDGRQRVLALRDQVTALARDRDLKPATAQALLDKLEAIETETASRLLDARYRLKAVTMRSEWSALFPPPPRPAPPPK